MPADTAQFDVRNARHGASNGFVEYVGPIMAGSDALIDSLRRAGFEVERSESATDLRPRPNVRSPIVLLDPSLTVALLPTVACVLEAIPDALPVALTSRIGDARILLALQRGVAGFCDPRASHAAVVRVLIEVRERGVAIPRHVVPLLVDHLRRGRGHVLDMMSGSVELTDREWEVLSLLRAGHSTAEIAASLYISPPTVRCHVSSLVHKFDAGDRDALVHLFDES